MQTAEGEGDPVASVVVSTAGRPDSLRSCLDGLAGQTPPPAEIIVVDASTDDRTYLLVTQDFPAVNYVRNPGSPANAAVAWMLGLSQVSSAVVVFVDDPCRPAPDWLAALLGPYRDPKVGGVGGRTAGEQGEGHLDHPIGRLRSDGSLSDHFDADPGGDVQVQYLPKSNMSFRRAALDGLAGPETGAGVPGGEHVELSLRVAAAGWKLIFRPSAVARYDGSPSGPNPYRSGQAGAVLLAEHWGLSSPEFRRYVVRSVRSGGRAGAARGTLLAVRRALTGGRPGRTKAGV